MERYDFAAARLTVTHSVAALRGKA